MTCMQLPHVSKNSALKLLVALILVAALGNISSAQDQNANRAASSGQAWVGARIIDGSGRAPIENATLYIRNGRIEAVGAHVKLPKGVQRIDASGKTIIPGLISAHSHLNDASQFGIYLRDGITTILSLGGDKEFALREQATKATRGTAPHVYVAGPIQDSTAIPGAVAVTTPEQARKSVDELISHKPDIVKVR